MAQVIVPNVFHDAGRLLDGMADRNRVRILCLLGAKGRMSVSAIAANFTMSRPAISHHLKVMLDSGLVMNEKTGKEVYYWVNCEGVAGMLRALADSLEECCREGKCC